MFVPSLSWQNSAFLYINGEKVSRVAAARSSPSDAAGVGLAECDAARAVRKTPVLDLRRFMLKRSHSAKTGSGQTHQ